MAKRGGNIYNKTGDGQELDVKVRKSGGVVNDYAMIQNDGHGSDSFKVLGRAGSPRFAVRRFHGGVDVVSDAVAGTLNTESLNAGCPTF